MVGKHLRDSVAGPLLEQVRDTGSCELHYPPTPRIAAAPASVWFDCTKYY